MRKILKAKRWHNCSGKQDPLPAKVLPSKSSPTATAMTQTFYSVAEALRNLADSKDSMDVTFVVGEERREVKGHNLILRSRSVVLETMLEDRWNSEKDKNKAGIRIVISLPIDPEIFEKFVKFIYTDDVEDCIGSLDFEDLLDMSNLAEMYGFENLREATTLKIAHDLVADYTNCYAAFVQKLDQDLRNVAWAVLKRNILIALNSDELLTKWTEEIWIHILKDESLTVDEIDLFEALYRWKEHKAFLRNSEFQKLLALIRFPLMDVQTLEFQVRSKSVLSDTQLLNITMASLGVMSKNNPFTFRGVERWRKVVYVSSSDELRAILDPTPKTVENSAKLNEIILLPGDYRGNFNFNNANLSHCEVKGFGLYTIFQARQCQLTFTAGIITLTNVIFKSQITLVHVMSHFNRLLNFRVARDTYFALLVKGGSNRFENFEMQVNPHGESGQNCTNCTVKQCEFASACLENFNLNLKSSQTTCILRSEGSANTFSSFECSPQPEQKSRSSYCLEIAGKDNVIENFNFAKKLKLASDWPDYHGPSHVKLRTDCTGLKVERSGFKSTECKGGDIQFKNCALTKVKVEGKGHKFEECKLGQVVNEGENVEITDCITVQKWVKVKDPSSGTINLGLVGKGTAGAPVPDRFENTSEIRDILWF